MTGINWELLEKAARALVDQNVYCEMNSFRSDHHGDGVSQTNIEHPCGHAGCFIGNCPFLGIEELKLVGGDFCRGTVDWFHYGLRVFGIRRIKHAELWAYLFGEDQSGDPERILGRVIMAKRKVGKEE